LSELAKRAPAPPLVRHLVAKVSSRWTFARFVAPRYTILKVKLHMLIMHYIQEFNARTAHINPGIPMPVRVTVRGDRSFHFDIRTPHTSWLLLNAANAPLKKGKRKGASTPGTETVGTVSLKHIYEIAKIKQSELRLSGLSLEGLCRSVIYQARSVGVEVIP